jgi:hypothetical protein
MKKILLFLLFCFPGAFTVNPPSLAQPVSGPVMFFQESHHDFKEVNEGAVVEHAFKVENRGDQVLEIKKVNPG